MKKLTKFVIAGAAVLVIGATSVTALAVSGAGPGKMMAGVGSRTYASSTAAGDSDQLETLQAQCLDRMKTALDARVAAGTMTQTQEDAILAEMKQRQEAQAGTGCGYGMMGGQNGCGYGMMGGR